VGADQEIAATPLEFVVTVLSTAADDSKPITSDVVAEPEPL
jgi:hypothetical protein